MGMFHADHEGILVYEWGVFFQNHTQFTISNKRGMYVQGISRMVLIVQ